MREWLWGRVSVGSDGRAVGAGRAVAAAARVGPKGGRREKHPRWRIVDAIFPVVRTGCAWRQLPKDFPPWPTVYSYFTCWHDDGTVERVHDTLRGRVREADGRAHGRYGPGGHSGLRRG